MSEQFRNIAIMVVISMLMLLSGLYLLAKFNSLFKRVIRPELLRKNIVVWLVTICLVFSILPTNPEIHQAIAKHKIGHFLVIQLWALTLEVLFVYNICRAVMASISTRNYSFRKRMTFVMITIILCTVIIGIPVNYLANGGFFKNLEFTLLFNFYTACMTGLVYVTMSYVDLDRKRKLNENELEIVRLRELKTKAELEALHSKINPHFLYNALNSIADLSVTDGKKARKMTVALADLFRYSINYSDHNYSTLIEELEMAEVYLQIEKIRFEDKLSYSVSVDEEIRHFLVPRFILQPIVENAVKHGLKATGKMTEIGIELKKNGEWLELAVTDNGPPFPDDLNFGYGVRSIYDKLELLFPGNYEVHFVNQPQKKVMIQIHKLIKNEPGI